MTTFCLFYIYFSKLYIVWKFFPRYFVVPFSLVFFYNLPFLKLYLCLVDTLATAKNSWKGFLDLSKSWNLAYL